MAKDCCNDGKLAAECKTIKKVLKTAQNDQLTALADGVPEIETALETLHDNTQTALTSSNKSSCLEKINELYTNIKSSISSLGEEVETSKTIAENYREVHKDLCEEYHDSQNTTQTTP